MKSFISVCLAFSLIVSLLGFFVGSYLMVHDFFYDKSTFMQSFQVFMLSAILLFTSITSFVVVKVLTNTDLIIGSIGQRMPTLPQIRFTPVQMEGNPQDFFQALFGQMPGGKTEKTLTEMSMEELKAEESKAIENEDFKRAAEVLAEMENRKKEK